MIDRGLLELNMRSFMYVHAARRRKMTNFLSIVCVIAAVVAIPMSASMMPAWNASGDEGTRAVASEDPSIDPKLVNGYIYTMGGAPVNGASVVVKMINGGTTVDTQSIVTGADGFYGVTFDKQKWGIGWTIRVEATKDTQTGVNETACDAEYMQWVDATLGLVIPEFSTYAPLIAGFLLVTLLAAGSSRRKGKGA